MSTKPDDSGGLDSAKLQEMVAESDTGGRKPTGAVATALMIVALSWSLFQLWYASPLPFTFNILVFNATEARSIHLAFAIFLAYTAYPAFKRSPRAYVPVQDWVFAAVGAFCTGYIFLFYSELSTRPGQPITQDLVVAVIGMVLLLEATRRVLGPPMTIVALVFLTYTFGGQYMPDMIAHKGASLAKAMSHQWLTTEGVFGIALGVSSSFIFLFVLFGSLLDKAGAGNYFIKSAFALLGHMRGGPAKAAVVSSAATGIISGSSIANVVTTGTFTIPLMKRVGYRPDQAGAVEVSSSVNGQIMPPVMGAAAFLMVEYVGIPYTQVIKHAFLPAIISYIALFYIVHLEALKANLQGLPRRSKGTFAQRLLSFLMTVAGFVVLSGVVYYSIGWIKVAFPDAAFSIVMVLLVVVYLGLLWFGSRQPELMLDDPNAPVFELPETGPTLKSGLHYLLSVVVLIWCLMVEQLSPGLSAFWATLFMIFIMVTQRPLLAKFRGRSDLGAAVRLGFSELVDGLVTGARNMIGIGVATAAAGIIVGTVSLTGIGLVMTEVVELISGGNLMIMLLLVAFISLILGMGLPTTANYIVVSTLMAPVVVELGAQSGLLVPLIAVHMFVFYFGLMADVTPPVGLASFAAAAIARTDPIKTGVTAFFYSMRTAVLPFLFIFNTQLLLIGLDTWDAAIRRGDAGLLSCEEPLVRIAGAAAGHLHVVPARLLVGHGLSAACRGAGNATRSARRSGAERRPLAHLGRGRDDRGQGGQQGRAAAARRAGTGHAAAAQDRPDADDARRRGQRRRCGLRQPGGEAWARAGLQDHRHRGCRRAAGQGMDVHPGAGAAWTDRDVAAGQGRTKGSGGRLGRHSRTEEQCSRTCCWPSI